MAVDQLLALYDLDPAPALASVRLADCDLEFHRQRATNDIWCIAVGPLGAFPPLRIAEHVMLSRVRASGQDTSRPRSRPVPGLRIDIDENVAIVIRARGQQLEGTYIYTNGSPFGGFSGALPTRRELAPHLRLWDWLRGRRGSGRVEYAVRRERP